MRERRRSFIHVWLLSLAILTYGRRALAFAPTSTTSPLAAFSQPIRVNTASMNTRDCFLTLKTAICGQRTTSTTLLASNAASEDNDTQDEIMFDKERALGILVLLSVPLSWGTYGPVVRYLYELQPPVPGFVFSASYYVVASLTLLTLSSIQSTTTTTSTATDIDDNESDNDSSIPILGGLELGSYLFLANGLQILGLKTVPADRAGFLVQLTTVLVPIVQATLSGSLNEIPIPTWGACLLAFAGVIVMGLDGKESMVFDTNGGGLWTSLSSSLSTFTQGDLLIVLAAFVYTLHVVRLGKYAKETTPLKLAASKATTEAILSVGLVSLLWFLGDIATSGGGDASGLLAFAHETGRGISTFVSTLSQGLASGAIPTAALLPAIGATLWTGLVTCAYTIYAQSFGQGRVSPTDANLIYTVQPIFTALFAFFLLGETLGPAGFVGAALIGTSVYTVAMMSNK